jgi:flagellin
MGIVIGTNPTAMQTLRSLNKTNRNLQSSMVKLSSGMRINSARDDAAGLGISEILRAQVSSLGVASRNSADAISALQIAESSMNEIHNVLNRMRELAMQSSSGQLSNQQRGFLSQEMSQLREEVSRISATTEFNGKVLTDGTYATGGSTLTFQVGTHNTSNDRINVNITTMSATGLSIQSMSLSLQTSAQSALDVLDAAINEVSAQRASLGAMMNRLTITIDNLASAEENVAGANSRIRDVDVGKEMGKMVSNQILSQAGTSMLTQANSLPQTALALIG